MTEVFVLRPNDPRCALSSNVGGKASSLAVLNQIKTSKADNVNVPPFFALTTTAFVQFIGNVKSDIEQLESLARDLRRLSAESPARKAALQALFAKADFVREAVEKLPMPEQLLRDVHHEYAHLCELERTKSQSAGAVNLAVAVRSSATSEDTKDASFAGQHVIEVILF